MCAGSVAACFSFYEDFSPCKSIFFMRHIRAKITNSGQYWWQVLFVNVEIYFYILLKIYRLFAHIIIIRIQCGTLYICSRLDESIWCRWLVLLLLLHAHFLSRINLNDYICKHSFSPEPSIHIQNTKWNWSRRTQERNRTSIWILCRV